MSLPYTVRFLKNKEIVALGFCNIGWFERPEDMARCLKEALNNADDWFSKKEKFSEKYVENNSAYFKTYEEFQQFDEAILYDVNIPRKACYNAYYDKITSEQFGMLYEALRLSQESEENVNGSSNSS